MSKLVSRRGQGPAHQHTTRKKNVAGPQQTQSRDRILAERTGLGQTSGMRPSTGGPWATTMQQVQKAGSGFGAVLSGIGGRGLRRVAIAGAAALMFGTLTVPTIARADYVQVGPQVATMVQHAELKPRILRRADTGESEFDPGRLEEYPLFDKFWNSEIPGTSMNGVWALSPEGVNHLLEYARTHTLDGTPLASPSTGDGPIAVSEGHQALIDHLLNHDYFPAFIDQESSPLLRAAFDLPEAEVRAEPQHVPTDAGEVRVCSQADWWGTDFSRWAIRDLPRALTAEYRLGVQGNYYEGNRPIERKQYELTCLLNELARPLNSIDDLALPSGDQVKHQIQEELLDAFFALPALDPAQNGDEARALRRFFATDFNGSGMGLAQSIAKGFDANDFPTAFPNASSRGSPVSLSMSTGNLRPAMQVLDRLREAAGQSPLAILTKDRPSLGYMVGEPSGHDKITFNEARPPLNRLNYGKMILVGSTETGFNKDQRLSDLPPTAGFTFPIDAITATGAAVIASSSSRMEIYHQSYEHSLSSSQKRAIRLTVEPKFETNDAGEPVSWSLEFRNASGEVVPPNEVVGILRGVRSQGDGKANQSLATGYWGMCDDNTGANIIFGRFSSLPKNFTGQLEDDNRVFIRVGNSIDFVPAANARELVYMDLPGIGRTETPVNAGYRYGEDPSELRWQRGNTIHTNFGEIEGFKLSPFNQSNHEWVGGDTIRIPNSPSQPILGTLRLNTGSSTSYIQAADVISIVRQADDKVKVFYRSGSSVSSKTGVPLTDLSHIDWDQAELGVDPGTKTPGRNQSISGTQEPGTTIATYFADKLEGTGVSVADVLRANPEITSRPAATVIAGEKLTIPESTRSIPLTGQTVGELLAAEAERTGATHVSLRNANKDHLVSMATLILEPGSELTITLPEHQISPRSGDGLIRIYNRDVAPLGISQEDFFAANQSIVDRRNSMVRMDDQLVVPAGGKLTHTVAEGETVESILPGYTPEGVGSATMMDRFRSEHSSMYRDLGSLALPADGTVDVTIPQRQFTVPEVEGQGPQTLAQIVDAHGATFGADLETMQAANEHVGQRVAGWIKSGDKVIVPELAVSFADQPFEGDLFMRRSDGVDVTVRASEVQYVQGETPHDVRFTHYVGFVQDSKGVYGNEGSLTRSISNGRRWVDNISLYETRGADRPEFAGNGDLRGISGPLVRRPGDKMVFAAGTGGTSTTFAGWYQVDESTGRILNEGFIKAEPDFLWGIHDTGLNWHARSTYIGSAMTPEVRIGIVVNGTEALRTQSEEGDQIAQELGLPGNWRSYIVSPEEIQQHLSAEQAEQPVAVNQ